MKNFRVVLSLLLVISLCMTFVSPAFAADIQFEGYVEADNHMLLEFPDKADENVNWDGLSEYIVKEVLNRSENIDIRDFQVPFNNDNVQGLSNIIYATPKLLRYVSRYSYSRTPTTGTNIITRIVPEYMYGAEEFEVMREKAQASLENIIADLRNSNMPDVYKVLLVHDRVATMTEYDYANYLDFANGVVDSMPEESYSAYGVLVNKSAVCQGYTYVINWALDELGIESYEVDSDILNHAWNKVKLDGKTYFLDSTHDDPVWDVSGKVLHSYFLVSANTYSQLHSGANDFDLTEATDTSFESNQIWNGVNSEFQLIGDKLYYIDTNTKSLNMADFNGNVTVLKQLETAGYATVSRLVSTGTKLIYCNNVSLFEYDTVTGVGKKVFTLDPDVYTGYKIYGLNSNGCELKLEIARSQMFDRNTKSNALSYGNHTYSVVVTQPSCTEDGYTTHTCSVCNDTYITDKIAASGHKEYMATPFIDSNCVKEGKTAEIRCEKCQTLIHASTVINKKPHTQQVIKGYDATCESAGLSDGVKCSVCNEILVSQQVIPAGTHKYVVKTINPTCTKDGSSTATCSVCGDVQFKVLFKTGHLNTYGTKGVGATCTEDGLTPGTFCRDCNQFIAGHEVVKATGHKEQKLPAVPATCTTAGKTEGVKCSVCNVVLVSQETIQKLNHVDKNNDGYCDECGTRITAENEKDCSCNCHKTGFMSFIYRIQLLFWRIFGTNKVCACGVKHY